MSAPTTLAPTPSTPAAPSQPLALLEDLAGLIRAQEAELARTRQDHQRLQDAVGTAVERLVAMLAGARASRAELQAVVDTLRTAGTGEPVPPR